ncbi:Insulinoma-associated protein 1a [Bagarius yarrelli]|uniref:Insulinoma-associated protein 1a n=1 Tax=Bagarius yarrelli TaxID=175774 RepID=A0A556VU36_BAGYA|nr:Insulinoma-associated protein 1a [Bagarius yarrelli]
MPRGFLVKRSKRASGGSYRIRHAGAELQTSDPHALRSETPRDLFRTPSTAATAARALHVHPPELSAHAPGRSVCHSGVVHDNDEGHGAEEDCVRPARPLSRSPFPRCVTSPAAAESFPVSSIERLFLSSHARMKFSAYPLSFQQNRKLERKSAAPARKQKNSRKLPFQDEVTSSPVLGLRIKRESPERARVASSRKPLGEFICQLCREQYPDPLSLAQHRCSRIVRVEYRCPECDKVFSCPANLASHRRWHKPREPQHGKNTPAHDTASVEGKENASKMTVKQQQHLHPHPPPPPHQLLFFATETARNGMTPADTDNCFDLRSSSSDDGSRMYERRHDDTDSLAPGYLCARAGVEKEEERATIALRSSGGTRT